MAHLIVFGDQEPVARGDGIESIRLTPEPLDGQHFVQVHILAVVLVQPGDVPDSIAFAKCRTEVIFGVVAARPAGANNEYLSVRDASYLDWAIYNVLHWKQEKSLKNVIHIQGDDDHIFPIKHIKNCIPIEKGTHIMILNKAKSISKIIIDALT